MYNFYIGLDIFNQVVDMECGNNGEDSDIPSNSGRIHYIMLLFVSTLSMYSYWLL